MRNPKVAPRTGLPIFPLKISHQKTRTFCGPKRRCLSHGHTRRSERRPPGLPAPRPKQNQTKPRHLWPRARRTPRRSDKGRQPKNRAAARADHHTKPKHRRGNPRSGLCRSKRRKKIKRDKGGPSHEKCLSGTSQIRVRPALYSMRISEPTKHHVATSSSQPAHQLSPHHAPEAGGAVQMRGTVRQSL